MRVFISYSRVDAAIADRLVADLEARAFDVVIDRRDLPYGEEWQVELANFIRGSDTVVWLASQTSVKSRWCNWELGEVQRINKRLIPVRVSPLTPEDLPEGLGRIHVLPAEGVYDRALHLDELVKALETDRAWMETHTRLADRATEWIVRGRSADRLLRGRALSDAEAWRDSKPERAPTPNADAVDLILQSRRAATRGLRVLVGLAVAGFVVMAGLAGAALWQRSEAVRKELDAKANETVSLDALSSVASLEGIPVVATKLALAAWPRKGDETRPQLRRTTDSIGDAIASLRERSVLSHLSAVRSANFSTDGTRIVTSSGKWVQVWDSATAQPLWSNFGVFVGSDVESASFSSDGQKLLAIGGGYLSKIGKLGGNLEPPVSETISGAVSSAEFSPDGTRILAVLYDGTIRISDDEAGTEKLSISPEIFGDVNFASAHYSPDGRRIVATLQVPDNGEGTVEDEATAWILDAETGKAILPLRGHTEAVTSANYSPDGKQIVTTSSDSSLFTWDAESGGPKFRWVLDSPGSMSAATFSPDGKRVVVITDRLAIARVWALPDGDVRPEGEEEFGVSITSTSIFEATFSPDGTQLLTAMSDGTARLWDASDRQLHNLKHPGQVRDAAFSPDGSRVATASVDGAVRVWPSAGGQPKLTVSPEISPTVRHSYTSVSFSPDGKHLLAVEGNAFETLPGSMSPEVRDAITGELIFRLIGHTGSVYEAAYSQDGRRIVTASADNTIRLWDAATGAAISVVGGSEEGTTAYATSAALSHDGTRLAGSFGDGTLYVWDVALPSIHTLLSLNGRQPTQGLSFSPDGTRLLGLAADGAWSDWLVRVWDAVSGDVIYSTSSLGNAARAAYSPDGTRIAIGYMDGTVGVVDAASGEGLLALGAHKDIVMAVGYSPDGRQLVTASLDGSARIWDVSLETGDVFQVACQRLGNNTDLRDVEARYGLSGLAPICGGYAPFPVQASGLQ